MTLKGIPGAPGIGIGTAQVLKKELDIPRFAVEDSKEELDRFYKALDQSKQQVSQLLERASKNGNKDVADIMQAHLMMLDDPEFLAKVKESIENEKLNAEFAVWSVGQEYIQFFEQMTDEYLKARAADLKDITERIIRNLTGTLLDLSQLPQNTVLVARDLAPSDTAQIDREHVVGLVTDEGGPTSHVAIMARSFQIPAVVGTKNATGEIKNGDLLVVDGNEGIVEVNPAEDSLKNYEQKQLQWKKEQSDLGELITVPSVTKDGAQVKLEANIGRPEEVEIALKFGAEGVGLFRTEFLFMDRNTLPSEEEQFEAYKKALEGMRGQVVTIRTLDIGGDKDLPYLGLQRENNPFLGWRAIRYCLDRRDVLKTQLRAILRASVYGKAAVMFPMISSVEEVVKAKEVLEEAKAELREEGQPFDEHVKVGIMVEIPSAAVAADLLAPEVDFFSIGTNDLTQYTLAVDRDNEKVREYYNPLHPAVLRLIKRVIDVGNTFGKEVAMCGELAGDDKATEILLGLGLQVFSMTPSSIPRVKKVVLSTNNEEAQAIAKKAAALA
ncbi:MAG TPA: phosphoenolpyruvate--protein phosphotransferase [Coprothermobacter proteolyticus]|nr:phosphoenolpyruvate--protein phosphotransferase [Coprothermobacter proteolyticus]HOK24526.1 phosphoenolpyruvate--protein phosphotransferase [Coprothermobacter proteolyticus]HOL53475.1 phosphoenolpyruvate--protein phosphotransferase [Coprothermobacter proteolyticus]HPO83838.1 phosphoenolpyruvate--protein phosphotransferase [Coprothermobacter proteolyticus]HPZ45056.1 phosphoenolpyruvate--protein phosphotransferase [Coprothermobacter proteolyticus]